MGLLMKTKNALKLNKYRSSPTNSLNAFVSQRQLRIERRLIMADKGSTLSCPLPPRIDITCTSMAYGDRALPRLNRELESDTLLTRQRALVTLCDYLKDPEHISTASKLGTLERLCHSLFDKDSTVRCKAAECLYIIAGHGIGRQAFIDHKVIAPLSCLFQDAVPSVRYNAHAAFSRLARSPQAVEMMMEQYLIQMMVTKLSIETDEIIDVILETLHECFKVDVQTALNCSAMQTLTDLLIHANKNIRAHAARAIMGLALTLPGKEAAIESQCVKDLVLLLEDEEEEVLIYAAGALMRIGITTRGKYTELQAGALPRLLTLISHPNHQVRLYAVKALTGLAEAPEGRKVLLKHEDELRGAWADENESVSQAGEICIKVVKWKP